MSIYTFEAGDFHILVCNHNVVYCNYSIEIIHQVLCFYDLHIFLSEFNIKRVALKSTKYTKLFILFIKFT